MEENACANAKKSLMNSIGRLKQTVEIFSEIAYESDRMVALMRRTETQPVKNNVMIPTPVPSQDIIDLIDSVNDSIRIRGEAIMGSIQTVSSMIE